MPTKASARSAGILSVYGEVEVKGLLMVVAFAVTAPPAKRNMGEYFADISSWKSLQPEIEQALTRLDGDISDFKEQRISRMKMLERMEFDRLPEMKNTALQLGQLHLPIEDPIGRRVSAMTQLTSALSDLMAAEIAYSKNPSPEYEQKIRELAGRVIQFRNAFVSF